MRSRMRNAAHVPPRTAPYAENQDGLPRRRTPRVGEPRDAPAMLIGLNNRHAMKEEIVDQQRFAVMTQTLSRLPSRRNVLHGLTAAGLGFGSLRLAETEAAKHKGKKKKKKKKTIPGATCTPRCGRRQCGSDGCGGSCGSCAADQVCATGTCCIPEPREVTCTLDCGHGADCPRRCDTVRNPATCGQAVACTCPSGEACLGNSSCGKTCDPNTLSCPSGCGCYASVDAAGHCYGTSYCSYSTQVCAS